MVDNLNAFLAIWNEQISKFSPTMVDNLRAFLAIWDHQILKVSSTMVDNISAFFAIVQWESEVYLKYFKWTRTDIIQFLGF